MNLQQLRISKGVKLIKIVELFGIPLRTVQHWEAGTRETSAYNIDRIRACLTYLREGRDIFAGYVRQDGTYFVARDKFDAIASAREEWKNTEDKTGKHIVAGVFSLEGGKYTGHMWEVYEHLELPYEK